MCQISDRLAALLDLGSVSSALVRVYVGHRAADACRCLGHTETDPTSLQPARVALIRLTPIDRRNVLGS